MLEWFKMQWDVLRQECIDIRDEFKDTFTTTTCEIHIPDLDYLEDIVYEEDYSQVP